MTGAKDLYLKELRSTQNPSARDKTQLNLSKIIDGDPVSYDFEKERNGLDTFIKFNVDQNIIPEYISPENLFATP